jgi:tripartite ATP-independent transporter DctP family solute receptor
MNDRESFRTSRRRFLNVSMGGGASLLLASRSPAATPAPAIVKLPKKITFKAATITAETFPYVEGFKFWKSSIERRTGGEVDFQIFHTAQLGDERTINEGILAGAIQAGVGAGAWAGFVPAYNVVELPFLIRDMKQMYSLADGALGAKIGEQAEAKGFKVLAYYSTGDQHFQSRKAAIRSLADFKGMKMRVIQNKAVIDGFRALGAVPTPLPYPEIYTALQQGTVDGTGNDLLTVTLAKFYEVARFFTWSSYLVEPRPVIMAKGYFDALPADFQQLLIETARESAIYERKVFEDRSAGALEQAKKAGMIFADLTDREKWVDVMRPVWNDFGKATPGAAELIKIIQQA